MSAETADTRRAAGALVEHARTSLFPRVSKRALAARIDVSETWYRSITVGLGGRDPQPASDEVWVALATEVGLPPEELFAALGRPLPDGWNQASPADPQGREHRGHLIGPEWPLREGEVLEWETLASGKIRWHLYSTETGRGADYAWQEGADVERVVAWLRELQADVDEAVARMLRKRTEER